MQTRRVNFQKVYGMVDFHRNGKKPMLSLFIRKVINKPSKTIVQFYFYLFVWKYLNACFMTLCLIFFSKYNFFSPNQSGFIARDSCINQLLSINHGILSAFDMGLDVRWIFLDISKAFDKVWHDGLIFKLHQNGICSEMIYILEDFLSDKKQRVVLNGQCSSWSDIHAGVPQG